jgi:hypothetical protein
VKNNETRVRENKLRRAAIRQGSYLVKANRADIWFLMTEDSNVAVVYRSLDEVESALGADSDEDATIAA